MMPKKLVSAPLRPGCLCETCKDHTHSNGNCAKKDSFSSGRFVQSPARKALFSTESV
jgi:hypothetical protein